MFLNEQYYSSIPSHIGMSFFPSRTNEFKDYWAEMLDCKPNEIFVGGGSSLTLMYDVISKAFTHGLRRSERPWCQEEKVRFLWRRLSPSFFEKALAPTRAFCYNIKRKGHHLSHLLYRMIP